MKGKKTVMVFGTFDGLHEGHRFFLREARAHGDYLMAIVTPDIAVRKLKSRAPRAAQEARRTALLKEALADEAVIGDEEIGSWRVLTAHHPDIICLGYDQHSLKSVLESFIKTLSSPPRLISLPKSEKWP